MKAKKPIEQILAAEGMADYAQDLRHMAPAELTQLFAFASSGQLNTTRLIKNLVWQAYTWIRDGKREPIEGNLRSFWYTDVKPVLSRLGLPVEGRRFTELVYDVFVELVTHHHLFAYRDLGFLAEKAGRFALVRDLARASDATALALGGYPSSLATEYLLQALLRQQGVLGGARAAPAPLHLFSVVDYDPSGYWIEREFAEQLRALGVGEVTLHPLIRPERLAPERVHWSRYELKKDAKTANWLQETGGIGGEPYGLEADAFTKAEIRAAFVQEATPYLQQPAAAPRRLRAAGRRRRVLSLEAVVERIMQMGTAERRELERRLRERRAQRQAKA